MFTHANLQSRHHLADAPIEMPVNYAMVLPPYTTKIVPQTLFNLPLQIETLLGSEEWHRENRIVVPYFWTPGLTEAELPNYFPNSFVNRITSYPVLGDFPGLGRLSFPDTSQYLKFDIVHFIGRVIQMPNGGNGLDLGISLTLTPDYLEVALRAAHTRLAIFQTDSRSDFARATMLGRFLVENGGPIALIVGSGNQISLNIFYANILADVIHNIFPENLAKSPTPLMESLPGTLPDLECWLVSGEGSQELFKFDRYRLAVNQRLAKVKDDLIKIEQGGEQLVLSNASHLHARQRERLLTLIKETKSFSGSETEVSSIEANLKSASKPWDHEREGAIPLSMAVTSVERLEASIRSTRDFYETDLKRELDREIEQAPRVLNANFADPRTRSVLKPTSALIAGEEYDLLVDIGPRWNQISSIVSGKSIDFPENALPPGPEGFIIEVMIISQDFSPSIVSTELWLPRSTGRSFPMLDGKKEQQSGPVALRLRAPTFPKRRLNSPFTARARLNLYYENNLLQSAVITAGVAREGGVVLEQPNSVEIDYILSGGFQGVEGHFTTRALQIGETNGFPVKINLSMNDSGNGRHLFIVKGRLDGLVADQNSTCPPRAWIPYDSEAGKKLLVDAREQVLNIYYEKDKNGYVRKVSGTPVYGLKETNRKERSQFKLDLFNLAAFGYGLWAKIFNEPVIEGGACRSVRWQRNLQAMLTNTSLIQVSHLGPSQYVFPWSLIYEHPLILSENVKVGDFRYCDIINDEWSEDGLRISPAEERTVCPYHNEEWHAKNVICPYGIWGLKHVLEEPISLSPSEDGLMQGNLSNEVRLAGDLTLAVALTADESLSKTRIDDHIKRIKDMGVRLVPVNPAQNWTDVRSMLRAPEIVYFLCHGEYDPGEDDDYLSIGPRDENVDHRIYNVHALKGWTRDILNGPDIDAWEDRGPLVFINGCHTANLMPGKIVSFASTFTELGASGVLGTEISVDLPVAIEVAESLLKKIGPPTYMNLGKALRLVRWELVNKGNLLGLAYTLYGLADLKIIRAGN